MDDTGICEHCGKLIKFDQEKRWWVTEKRGKRGQIKQDRFCNTTPEFPVRVHAPATEAPDGLAEQAEEAWVRGDISDEEFDQNA